tara:strand:- start:26042 stop:26821 length:780 start_codon:yes stop_codon:yes gene_type:complete
MRYLALVLITIISFPIFAGPAEEKGLEIAKEADNRDKGFQDQKADLKMILRNRQGDKSVRKLSIKTLEGKTDGDKSLILFSHPKDVDGTALLTFTHKTDADDQWLFLPALKRVKRIASQNKSGPFMGSEFSYEDFTAQEVEKYDYKYIKNTPCGGKRECFKIERYPKDKYSGYKREVVWLDTKHYRTLKVEFYDKKDDLLKTLKLKNYKKYLGKYWRAHKLEMYNHQTKKRTTLLWRDFEFKNNFDENDFNQSTLRRAG